MDIVGAGNGSVAAILTASGSADAVYTCSGSGGNSESVMALQEAPAGAAAPPAQQMLTGVGN
jgi:hypothetical protein